MTNKTRKSKFETGNSNKLKISNFKFQILKKGFTLIELMIVVIIIGVLSTVSYVAIQRAKARAMNEKMLDDLVVIANALEDYRRDHDRKFPIPQASGNQNVLCFYRDATYAHDCADSAFIQGMIDTSLLSSRYLREVPADPRSGSRYVYGVTRDGKYFQVAGLFEKDDGVFEARTVENLAKGFELPSIIRAFDGPNFVVDKGTYLPYSPYTLTLTATLDNIQGSGIEITRNSHPIAARNGLVLEKNDKVVTGAASSADIYFSDGSITRVEADSELILSNLEVSENNSQSTITKILLKLNAGKIWSKVVRLAEKSTFEVETTSAIAGVRGTEFGAEKDGDGMVLRLLAGRLRFGPRVPDRAVDWNTLTLADAVPTFDQGLQRFVLHPQRAQGTTASPMNVLPLLTEQGIANYYTSIRLNNNIRPRVLSADASGNITVGNINAMIPQTPLGLTRTVEANRLVAYQVIDQTPPLAFLTSMDISNTPTGDYTISGIPQNVSVVLRFEQWKIEANITSDTDCSLAGGEWIQPTSLSPFCVRRIRVSGFSVPPVRLGTGTLTDPSQLGGITEPALTVTAPEFAVMKSGTANQTFTVGAAVQPLPSGISASQITYLVNSTTAAVCQTQTASPFTVGILTAGACDLKFEASWTDSAGIAKTLTETKTVRIIPETEKLFLLYPPESAAAPGPVIYKAGQPIEFKWNLLNPPAGVSYQISIVNITDLLKPVTLGPASSTTPSFTVPGSLIPPTLQAGSYKWTITASDSSANTLAEKTSWFKAEDAPTAEFGIAPATNNPCMNSPLPTTGPLVCEVLPDTASGLITAGFTVSLPTAANTSKFEYKWFFPSVWKGSSLPPQTNEASVTATLTVSSGSMQEGSVILNVYDPASSVLAATMMKRAVVKQAEIKGIVASPSPLSVTAGQTGPVDFTVNVEPIGFVHDSNLICSLSDQSLGSISQSTASPYGWSFSPAAVPNPLNGDIICTIPANTVINGYKAYAAKEAKIMVTVAQAAAVCGDGVVDTSVGEQCDDGKHCADGIACTSDSACANISDQLCKPRSGDGCMESCAIDPGWTCTGAPSVCTMKLETACVGLPTDTNRATIADGSTNSIMKTFYRNSDQTCWKLGNAGNTCTAACQSLYITGGGSLQCDASTSSPWNADSVICGTLKSGTVLKFLIETSTYNIFAPYMAGTYCWLRNANKTQDCTEPKITNSYERICKCVAPTTP